MLLNIFNDGSLCCGGLFFFFFLTQTVDCQSRSWSVQPERRTKDSLSDAPKLVCGLSDAVTTYHVTGLSWQNTISKVWTTQSPDILHVLSVKKIGTNHIPTLAEQQTDLTWDLGHWCLELVPNAPMFALKHLPQGHTKITSEILFSSSNVHHTTNTCLDENCLDFMIWASIRVRVI